MDTSPSMINRVGLDHGFRHEPCLRHQRSLKFDDHATRLTIGGTGGRVGSRFNSQHIGWGPGVFHSTTVQINLTTKYTNNVYIISEEYTVSTTQRRASRSVHGFARVQLGGGVAISADEAAMVVFPQLDGFDQISTVNTNSPFLVAASLTVQAWPVAQLFQSARLELRPTTFPTSPVNRSSWFSFSQTPRGG